MSRKVFEKDYNIHYYEVDYKKRCLVTSLMNYFQDIAITHGETLGAGVDYVRENNIAWILYKWDIKIKKYPMYGDKVKIRTITCSFIKFYAYRKFEVFDDSGEKIAEANTVWLLLNIRLKKPIKIIDTMYEIYGIDKNNSEALNLEDPGELLNIDVQKEFNVRYSDIDTNGHVNNVKYVDWSLETVPVDVVLKYILKSLKVTYKRETKYGEAVKAVTEVIRKDGEVLCHHKILDSEGRELCILETLWNAYEKEW